MTTQNLESEITDSGDATLARLGLAPLPTPKVPRPISDLNIDTLPNDQLAALYAEHVSYAQFVGVKIAQHKAYAVGLRGTLDRHVAELKIGFKKEKIPDSQVASLVKIDPELVELEDVIAQTKAVTILLEAYLNNYKAQYAALSRIVTIRQIDIDQTRLGPSSSRARGGRPERAGLRTGPGPAVDDEGEEPEEEEEDGDGEASVTEDL